MVKGLSPYLEVVSAHSDGIVRREKAFDRIELVALKREARRGFLEALNSLEFGLQ